MTISSVKFIKYVYESRIDNPQTGDDFEQKTGMTESDLRLEPWYRHFTARVASN